MKENEKKTSDQDVELNLDEVGDKVVGGRRSLKKSPFVEYEFLKKVEVIEEACKKEVVSDRNGYLYHGKVPALDDAAREAGLEF